MRMICNKCKNFIKYVDGSEGEFVLKRVMGTAYETIYLCNKCLNECTENYYRLEGAYPVMVSIEEKRG